MADFDKLFSGKERLLIVLHNNPDPDAIASAFALGHLVRERYNVPSSLAYGGFIGRAENQAMVTQLKIPLKKINRIRLDSYDRVALVDTQPGAGNNSLPLDVECHIVIDHHYRRRGIKSKLRIIDPEIGATATMLVEFLYKVDCSIPSDVATALVYAIRSETQDLGRETSSRDIKAYLSVLPKASMRKLAKISHPKLARSYFIILAKALKHAMIFRNLIYAHLGDLMAPEIVAEIADVLLRHKRIGWSMCTGRYRGDLIISLRSSNPKAKAGKIIKRMVPDPKHAGGHDTFAGGKIQLISPSEEDFVQLERKLTQDFAQLFGYKKTEWKPLLD